MTTTPKAETPCSSARSYPKTAGNFLLPLRRLRRSHSHHSPAVHHLLGCPRPPDASPLHHRPHLTSAPHARPRRPAPPAPPHPPPPPRPRRRRCLLALAVRPQPPPPRVGQGMRSRRLLRRHRPRPRRHQGIALRSPRTRMPCLVAGILLPEGLALTPGGAVCFVGAETTVGGGGREL